MNSWEERSLGETAPPVLFQTKIEPERFQCFNYASDIVADGILLDVPMQVRLSIWR